jgi:hypothetical protein
MKDRDVILVRVMDSCWLWSGFHFLPVTELFFLKK